VNQCQVERLSDRPVRLELADACRDAANDFCRGVTAGWTKRGLVDWLQGPYAMATSFWPRPHRTYGAPRVNAIANETINLILTVTLRDVLAVLGSIGADSTDFVVELSHKDVLGHVLLADEPAWVPIDLPRTPLRDRVLSLFAADKLARPQDYTARGVQCPTCAGLVFVAGGPGCCADHCRPSAVARRPR
jgi:hypothetical protein